MGKILSLIIFFILVFSFPTYSSMVKVGTGNVGVPCQNITTESSTSQAILSGKAAFAGIIIKTDGVNNVTLNIYDNTTASGKKIIPTNSIILGTSNISTLNYNPPIKCDNGVYVSVSVAGGGTCSYQVIYDAGN